MSKETGIIFIDVISDIKDKLPKKPPVKVVSLLFVILMVFSAFTMLNFATQPANASPPATGDTSFLNTSFSTNYAAVQSGSSSSYSTSFGEHGPVKVYVHIKDSNNNQANSTVLNQTINPAAAPSSPSSMNTSNIHPLTTTTGYVYFNETGLPASVSWSVTYNGLNSSSTTTSIKFSETVNVLYSYTVHNSASGIYIYQPSPSSGSAKAPSSVSITFSEQPFTANITTSQNPTDVGELTYYYSHANNTKPGNTYEAWEYINGVNKTSVGPYNSNINFEYTYGTAGTYTYYFVWHVYQTTITFDTPTLTITVDPALTVSITASTSTIDYGQSVTFTATASGGSGSYTTYDFYVNGVSEQSGSSNTYTTTSLAVGSDSVYVAVTDTNSYTVDSPTITETVNSDPSVSISSNDNPSTVNTQVTFTASASGGTTPYTNYAFYMNSNLEQSGPSDTWSYTFSSTGSYSIYVVVTDTVRKTAQSTTLTQTVNSPALSVSLSVNYNPIDAGVTASFTASASGGSGTYSDYYFYIQNTLESTQTTDVYDYTFGSAGSYTVGVKVVDSSGNVAWYNMTETVDQYVYISSDISSNVNPSIPNYQFTLSMSAAAGTGSYTYYWYTSSGSLLSSGSSSSYTTSESTSGSYGFYVVVYDTGGGSATTPTFTETVNPDLTTNIASSSNPSVEGNSVTFTAEPQYGSGTYTNYEFYLNGVSEQNGASSTWSYTFTAVGNYSVYVVVTDSLSETAQSPTLTQKVESSLPTVTLTSSANPSTVGQKVYFNATISGGTSPYVITFYLEFVSASFATETYTYSITQYQNTWNSSYIYFNNTILSGVTFPNIYFKGTVTNLTLAKPTAPVDAFLLAYSSLSPYSTAKYSAKNSYNVTGWQNVTSSSSVDLKIATTEVVNYDPSITTQPTVSFVTGSEAQVSFTTSETISGEKENIAINWGDSHTTTLSSQTPGTFTETHIYSGSYTNSFAQQEGVYVTVTNIPNFEPSQYQLTTTSNTYTYSFSSVLTPSAPGTILNEGEYVWMNVTTYHISFTSVSVLVNGIQTTSIQVSSTSWKVTSPEFALTFGPTVQWTFSSPQVTDTEIVQYGTNIVPTVNSSYLVALYSNTATSSYPITLSNVPSVTDYPIALSGVPSGTGMYQQLLAINPSTYGISSSGGNVLFYDSSNSTPLCAWLQNINSTSASYWVKNFNGSNGITMRVVPGADYFSATGYLGEAPQLSSTYGEYDNGVNVFNFYDNFAGTNLNTSKWTVTTSSSFTVNNGLTFTGINGGGTDYIFATSVPTFSAPLIVDMYAEETGTAAWFAIELLSLYGSGGVMFYNQNPSGGQGIHIYNGTTSYATSGGSPSTMYFWTATENGGIASYYMRSGSVSGTVVTSVTSGSSYYSVNSGNIYLADGGGSAFVQYMCVRTYVSSMPTYSINSGSSATIPNQPSYQQLFTISSPSSYGVNSQGSNIQFTASNGSLLYAWIQSINSSSMQIWVRNYYGNSAIDMQVLPSFENLFSATGYLQSYKTSAVTQASFNYNRLNGTAYYANVSTFGQVMLALNQSTSYRAYVNFPNIAFTGQSAYVSGYFWQSNPSVESYSRMIVTSEDDTGWFEAASVGGILYINGNGTWKDTGYTFPTSSFYLSVYTNGTNGFYVYVNGALAYHYTSVTGNNGNLQVGSTTAEPIGGNQFFGAVGDIKYSTTRNLTQPSMPTFTIGAGSVFQANATSFNTTHQHYESFTAYQYNLSQGTYTYSIPDSFNSKYVTLYYNASWTLEYASYVYEVGTMETTSGSMPFITFLNVAGIGTIKVTFLEPIVIGQPLGTMSLGVLPSIAINGYAFFELPNNLLHWTANGQPINPNGFDVVVGKPVTIKAFSGSNIIVYNKTVIPTSANFFLQAYVNVTQMQFINLNSTVEVQVSATSNGTIQGEVQLSPYGTGLSSQDLYLPSGKYSWNYTELNYTTGQIVRTVSVSPDTYNGMNWITIQGFTIYQMGDQLKYANNSIQSAIQTLKIIISLNDTTIKNLVLGISLNLNATNSSIGNLLTKVLVNESLLKSIINNNNITISQKLSALDSTINVLKTNMTALFKFTDDLMNTTNISIQDKLSVIDSLINSNQVALTTKINYVETILNQSSLTLTNKINFVDSILNSTSLSISNKISFVNSLVNSTSSTIITDLTNLNSTVKTQFLNVLADVYNLNTSMKSQFVNVATDISNINASLTKQLINVLTNITNSNSSLTNQYVSLLTDFKNLNTSMVSQYLALSARVVNMNSSIVDQLAYEIAQIQDVNSTVFSQYVGVLKELTLLGNKSQLQYMAMEASLFNLTGSIKPLTYQLISQNGSYSNGIYNLPVVVLSWQDTAEPTPITISLLRNLTVEYIQGSSSGIPVHFTAESISQHGFMLRLSISVAQLKEIDSGSAKLLLNSNFNGTNGAGIVTSMPYTVPATLYSFLIGYAVYFESYQGLTILMTILGLVLALMSVSIDVRSIRKMNNGGRR